MSFEALVPVAKAAKATEPVRVGVRVGSETARTRLFVLLKRDLIDQVSKGATTATVELGKSEDRHLLRIKPNGKGDFDLTQMPVSGHARKAGATSPVRILLPPNDRWPICKIKAQGASYKVGKGCIDIELPAWAWDAGEKASAEGRHNP